MDDTFKSINNIYMKNYKKIGFLILFQVQAEIQLQCCFKCYQQDWIESKFPSLKCNVMKLNKICEVKKEITLNEPEVS